MNGPRSAQFDPGNVAQLHAGQQHANVIVGAEAIEGRSTFAERKQFVLAITDHLGHSHLHDANFGSTSAIRMTIPTGALLNRLIYELINTVPTMAGLPKASVRSI